ncbi:MAG TPA: amino acid adenylation domain-containing protein, partial [Legionellaceae bacterium]|nr:amino acid adenylation domain-containing protein [Legionellaceae bacterium]
QETSGITAIVKHHLHNIFKLLPKNDIEPLREIIFGHNDSQKINETQFSQIALFIISYALAKALIDIGITPIGMVGHSIGEITAATIAGVFALEDALEIIRFRGDIMQQQPSGAMLSVLNDTQTVRESLSEDLWLALENTTCNCVVGGSHDAIADFEIQCEQREWITARIKTSHAFHTPMMNHAAQEFRKKIAAYRLNKPQIPIVSNQSGTWATEEEMVSYDYWADHIINPVHFSECLSEILKTENAIVIEVGPSHILSSFAKQHSAKRSSQQFINLVRHPRETENDEIYLNNKLGQLWGVGIDIDWYSLKGQTSRYRVSLPTYVFDQEYFPIDTKINDVQALNNPSCELMPTYIQQGDMTSEEGIADIISEAYKIVLGLKLINTKNNFFVLGGDSLKAISLVTHLHQKIGVKIDIKDIFKYPTPETLGNFLKQNSLLKSNTYFSIQPTNIQAYYPLSSAQRRMYTLYLLDKNSLAYNLPSATRLQGKLDKARFEHTIKQLIAHHEPLRTRFAIIDNQPVQIIDQKGQVSITYAECHETINKNAIDQMVKDFIKPFDLHAGPLFRIHLITLGHDNYLFLCDVHHIIADGTSMEIITRDFNQLYIGTLPKLTLQYKDFSVWQSRYLHSDALKQQKEFWLQYLQGDIPVLELPNDFQRPTIKQSEGDRFLFTLNKTLTKKLTKLSKQEGTTLFMTLLSAWKVLLARYSGQTDIIVGVPVAGRNQPETTKMCGMFVNILPIRNQVIQTQTFSEFLQTLKENVLNAFKNQDYQFDELVHHLNIKRDLGRNALFDVCFDFQNMEFQDFSVEKLQFTPYPIKTNTSTYDLLLTIHEHKQQEKLHAFIEYSTALFKKETIERLVENFKTLLKEILNDREVPLASIDLVSSKEQKILHHYFNQPSVAISSKLSIAELFEKQVNTTPNHIAYIFSNGKEYTYAELNAASNSIAWYLLSLNLNKNSIVSVMTSRDETLLIAILGILKAGAAFLLIDPSMPKERIFNIFSQSKPSVLLHSDIYQNDISYNGITLNLSHFDYAHNPNNPPKLEKAKSALAYIMFTSGSTGKPKGVMIKQSSLINFIEDVKKRGLFQNNEDRMLSITTVSFDIFIFESLVPLCTGHSVYLANEIEQLDPALVTQKITLHQITHIISTVTRIKSFVENPTFKTILSQLKCIISGGEHFPLTLLQELQSLSSAKIYNMYGPTEATIWATAKELTNAQTINIGRPITNTQVYVVNSSGKIQPIGVTGELCLAGHGLAHGYVKNSENADPKFTYIAENIPVYRTGDLAKFLDTGELVLQGRLDTQIKIRGYRIELAEIENTALQHDAIRLATAIGFTDKNGVQQIALYYCIQPKMKLNQKDFIQDWLKTKLPHYMIPAYCVALKEMPLLPNGKIDQNALPLPSKDSAEVLTLEKSKNHSNSHLETRLLELWKEELSADHISLHDNFFELGGHSLNLIQINNKLSSELNYPIDLLKFFQYPTIESFVKNLSVNNKTDDLTSFISNFDNSNSCTDIAVIGLSGQFPGAQNLEQFWNNIVSGTESITQFPQTELLKNGIDPQILTNPNYVRAKGFLENVEYFDAEFFGYTQAEANTMDPQIRLLHQCAWETLEHAGYNPFDYDGSIGLFAGSSSNILWMSSLLKNHQDFLNAFETITLNEKDFITTRLSYKLNLRGPSINVQTACSTSLVAINQATQALINGECDMALAGGVSITFPRKEGYLWHEGLIFSRDGHCKPFSQNTSGIVPGNGCGLVLLKPLTKALQDGDYIYAIIKGSAINNDGIVKVGYTAPSIDGQCEVIQSALRKANIVAEEIDYLEAHGTGTLLGDPIEIAALKKAWQTDKKQYCALGSLKANIGHLDAAAGVASFIKATLILNKRVLPPLVNFTEPNTKIDLDNSPFYINKQCQIIADASKVLRIGVSSFGIGGTNAHLILEQAPMRDKVHHAETIHILPFSGQTLQTLNDTCHKVMTHLKNDPDIMLSDAAWTLQIGRKALEYRKIFIIEDHLKEEETSFFEETGTQISNIKKPIIFLLSTHAAQKNIRELYATSEKSRITCILKKNLDDVFTSLSDVEQNQFKNVDDNFTPLLNFATSYAVAQTCLDIGIIPEAFVGRDAIGIIVGLVIATAFSIQIAIEIIKNHFNSLNAQKSEHILKWVASQFKDTEYDIQTPIIPVVTALQSEDTAFLLESTPVFIEFGGDNIGHKCLDYSVTSINNSMFQLIPANIQNPMLHINSVIGKLWCIGLNIDWKALNKNILKKRIPLPTYSFQKQYHTHDIVLLTGMSEQTNFKNNTTPEHMLEILKHIWSHLFGQQHIDLEDDFFALGGDSLKAATLAAHIQKELGIEMPISEIFKHPTLVKMQNWLAMQQLQPKQPIIPSLSKRNFYPTSSAQKRMYAVHHLLDEAMPYNLAAAYLIEGNIDKAHFKSVFDEIVKRHEVFRTKFYLHENNIVQIIEDDIPSIVEFENYFGDHLQNKILENI